MNLLPKELEDIVNDYKNQLEYAEKFEKVCEGIDNISIEYSPISFFPDLNGNLIEINEMNVYIYLRNSKYNKPFFLCCPPEEYRHYSWEIYRDIQEQLHRPIFDILTEEQKEKFMNDDMMFWFDKNQDFHYEYINEGCIVCSKLFFCEDIILCHHCDSEICKECNDKTKKFVKCDDCDKYRCESCERGHN